MEIIAKMFRPTPQDQINKNQNYLQNCFSIAKSRRLFFTELWAQIFLVNNCVRFVSVLIVRLLIQRSILWHVGKPLIYSFHPLGIIFNVATARFCEK